MSLSRVYPAGWSLGEKLTSAQINSLDTQHTYTADKRAGQTDTIAAVWSASGAGRLIGTYAAGTDANTTYLVSGANSIIDVSTLTADRVYTLSNTNALAGDKISILNRANFYVTVQNAAATTLIVLGGALSGTKNGESFWADLIFNGTAWQLWRSSKPTAIEQTQILSTTTYIVPRSVTQMLAVLCGGGGGGAGGCAAAGSNRLSCGGGGGGGAIERLVRFQVIPGETLDATIGAGGPGGVALGVGGAGGDTNIYRNSDSSMLAYAMGAGGGSVGPNDGEVWQFGFDGEGPTARFLYQAAAGGSPTRGNNGGFSTASPDPFALLNMAPQVGGRGRSGHGTHALSSERGSGSPHGYLGGTSAAAGADSSTYRGGGGGGGGGAGPYGAGGNGGAGGAGNNAGAGGTGLAGSAAGANTGAGGGGGGASGASSTSIGVGGAGGAGGSGRIILIPTR